MKEQNWAFWCPIVFLIGRTIAEQINAVTKDSNNNVYSQVANRRVFFNKQGGQNFFQNSINRGS